MTLSRDNIHFKIPVRRGVTLKRDTCALSSIYQTPEAKDSTELMLHQEFMLEEGKATVSVQPNEALTSEKTSSVLTTYRPYFRTDQSSDVGGFGDWHHTLSRAA